MQAPIRKKAILFHPFETTTCTSLIYLFLLLLSLRLQVFHDVIITCGFFTHQLNLIPSALSPPPHNYSCPKLLLPRQQQKSTLWILSPSLLLMERIQKHSNPKKIGVNRKKAGNSCRPPATTHYFYLSPVSNICVIRGFRF